MPVSCPGVISVDLGIGVKCWLVGWLLGRPRIWGIGFLGRLSESILSVLFRIWAPVMTSRLAEESNQVSACWLVSVGLLIVRRRIKSRLVSSLDC
jgi:hypothetical protein